MALEGMAGGGSAQGDPLIGTRLGGYVIEALLGKGAMGAVYRAVQVSLNRHVALKVMAGHLVGSEESAARFWREARAAAAINHPNLVQVYDFGEAGGIYFYAMELVDGLSLGAYLRRGDRFTERECIEVGREVTLALRAAHRAGVIHRDLKPDNLMLNSEGVVKVADLGVARFRQMEGGEDSLTMTGVGMGTPAFMSPEQIRGGKETDHRSDFYALGATLFQLATCRLPFPGQTVGEILEKQFTAAAPRARDVNPALGDAFSNLVSRLMAKDPAARPQTHEEILVALEGCLRAATGEGGGTSRIRMADSPAGAWPARLLRLWPAWAAAVVAVAGLLMTRGPKEADPWNRFSGGDARAPIAERATEDTASPEVRGQERATPATPEAVPAAKAEIPVAPGSAGAAREAGAPVGSVVQPPAVAVAPASSTDAAVGSADSATATKEKPFVNSLGMKFVPIPGTRVLFSIWETRVKDFGAFVKESGYNWSQGAGFEQTPEDPVVNVSWDDARAFCDWLSKKEGIEYRLPTDEEWDEAAGDEMYPWGDEWPPPEGVENIGGEESMLGKPDDPMPGALEGYRDDHSRTAPVGSYGLTKAGLYDMGGNVNEFVEDWYTEALYKKHKDGGGQGRLAGEVADITKGNVRRVARGASWASNGSARLVSALRYSTRPGDRLQGKTGFRCVLVLP